MQTIKNLDKLCESKWWDDIKINWPVQLISDVTNNSDLKSDGVDKFETEEVKSDSVTNRVGDSVWCDDAAKQTAAGRQQTGICRRQ